MFLFYGNNSKTESVFAVVSAISCGIKYTEKYLIWNIEIGGLLLKNNSRGTNW